MAVSDALDVGGHYLGLIVRGEVLQQIAFIDIAGIPVGDGFAEADTPMAGGPDQVDGVSSALADKADVSFLLREIAGERQTDLGAVQPEAIGSEKPDAPGSGHPQQFVFQISSFLSAGL